ncbi:uncharacterized protein LOC132281105 [Cornus florida]|uniref:uncharacterized protein LOC132281105 n=1 Tax=Cornus florida TaxID=4283 RepID=UPI00289F1E12|nr:uncharacterized protein LOC132281105 [Cornus florida]
MANRLGSQNSHSSPSMAMLRFKLTRIASHHEQTKIAFHQLKSQIEISLIEAEDVFASLAIPLMSLVGLKTFEMAEEGRFSTIFMNTDSNPQGCRIGKIGSKTRLTSPSTVERGDQNHRIRKMEFALGCILSPAFQSLQEDSYTTKATLAAKELIQKQRLQLTQLVQLLRKIETQVNSSQNDILQTLDDHRASIHKFFQKATAYASAIHQSSQNRGTLLITSKLLKAIFDHVAAALSSVECGVEDLMHELAEQMCSPMVEYAKVLKTEMTSGACPRLLTIVEGMGEAMMDRRLELEKARKSARIAEERKIEALTMLKESEERVRKMKERLEFSLEVKKETREHSLLHKKTSLVKQHLANDNPDTVGHLLGMEKDQAKDENLLWELLRKKRKYQTPESPLGPGQLLCIGPNKHFKSAGMRTSTSHRPITRSYSRGLSPLTPSSKNNSWLPLGSSPSALTHHVLSRKRVTP